MKRFLSYLVGFLVMLLLISTVFFYWASSSTLDSASYASLRQNSFETAVDTDSVYSIVTYNIGYLSGMTNNKAVEKPKSLFDTHLKRVLGALEKVNPDIIALQEIDYDAERSHQVNQEEAIEKLGYKYIAKGVNWDERYLPFPYWPPNMHFGKVVSGQSILSKYPLKDYERIVLPRVEDSPFYRDAFYLERLLQVVKVTIENRDVVLLNVHLEAFDKKTRAIQLAAVMKEFKKYSASYPTILLGDFNSDPKYTDPVVQELFDAPGIGNAAFSKDNYDLTFDTAKPFERLDYIFFTEKTLLEVEGKVLKEFGQASDHLPVELRFKFVK